MTLRDASGTRTSRRPQIVMVVEPDTPGWWTVARVDPSRRAIVDRRRVQAAPLREPNARCIQRLGRRLLEEAGDAGCILFAIDRLAKREALAPSLLTAIPVPTYAASPSVTLANAACRSLRRFVFVDFRADGSVALVTRSDDGRISDFSPHATSLGDIAGIARAGRSAVDDWFADAWLSDATALGRAAFLDALTAALRPALDAAAAFGYGAVVGASRAFADVSSAAAFVAALEADRTGRSAFALSTDGERAIAGAESISAAAAGPGVWVTGESQGPILSLKAPHDVEYEVTHVARAVFDLDEPALANLVGPRPAMFVVDSHVERAYGDALRAYASRHVDCIGIVDIDGREESKSWAQVDAVCRRAIDTGLRRDGVIVAVGGGVTLDVAGLAASLYRRGVRFVRIPTTLVGMVDVCVGIKQGVNYAGKKSVIGAFYPSFGGINDLSFLRTLPRRHLACGVSEIVKMAIVRDPFLFELLEAHAVALMASHFQTPRRAAHEIVVRAELAMMMELQPNLFEHDYRRFVDFGHSFSQRLEAATHHGLHHGEAVGIDMLVSASIAAARGLCSHDVVRRIAALYRTVGLPVSHPLADAADLLASLDDIRIHRGGDLNLVVPTSIGSATFLQDVSVSEVAAALAEMGELDAGARGVVDREPAVAGHEHAVAGS